MSGPGVLESEVVAQWAHDRLVADADLAVILGVPLVDLGDRVWEDRPPLDAVPPLVMLSVSDPSDVRGVGDTRIMVDMTVLIRGVAQTASYTDVRPIAERIDVLFHGSSGPGAGGAILHSMREGIFRLPETDEDGQEWRHLGGSYRVWAQ